MRQLQMIKGVQVQPKQTQKFVTIPITIGTKPNFNTRLGYPQIYNLFASEGALYSTPWLRRKSINDYVKNARAIIKSNLVQNTYFIVTNNAFLKLGKEADITFIAPIKDTLLPVQSSSNQQNQIGFTDGKKFYVYSERTNDFGIVGEEEGMVYKNPISTVTINNITSILDQSGKWNISDANNMRSFPTIDSEQRLAGGAGTPRTLQTVDNNLFILGTEGGEKWVPSSGNNPYMFPFGKDNSFKIDKGPVSIDCSQLGFSEVYFLGSDFIPRILTTQGAKEIGDSGMAKVISTYIDREEAQSSFYEYLGHYFYHLYFPRSKNSWVYCTKSQAWANGDDHITCSASRLPVVGTPDGIFELTGNNDYAISKKRMYQSDRIFNYKGTEPYRMGLYSVEAKIVQGFAQLSTVEPQHIRLKISLDSESWLNSVPMPIGATGKREASTIWNMNLCGHEFTLNMQYQGTYNLIFEKVTAVIK